MLLNKLYKNKLKLNEIYNKYSNVMSLIMFKNSLYSLIKNFHFNTSKNNT